MKELLSPRQAAASLGVSESSFKRWCDQGVIDTVRTPGGHRRIQVAEVVRFARKNRHPFVDPEAIGLPRTSGNLRKSESSPVETLTDLIREGEADASRGFVLDHFLSGASATKVCEEIVAPAMHRIGDEWQCGDLQIYQEHQASEIINRTLYDLKKLLPKPSDSAPIAIGSTPPGDAYRLPTLMAEIVLSEVGCQAISLGTSLPFSTVSSAVSRYQPKLLWISVSHLADPEQTHQDFVSLLERTPDDLLVAVGGRLGPELIRESIARDRVRLGNSLFELSEMASSIVASAHSN